MPTPPEETPSEIRAARGGNGSTPTLRYSRHRRDSGVIQMEDQTCCPLWSVDPIENTAIEDNDMFDHLYVGRLAYLLGQNKKSARACYLYKVGEIKRLRYVFRQIKYRQQIQDGLGKTIVESKLRLRVRNKCRSFESIFDLRKALIHTYAYVFGDSLFFKAGPIPTEQLVFANLRHMTSLRTDPASPQSHNVEAKAMVLAMSAMRESSGRRGAAQLRHQNSDQVSQRVTTILKSKDKLKIFAGNSMIRYLYDMGEATSESVFGMPIAYFLKKMVGYAMQKYGGCDKDVLGADGSIRTFKATALGSIHSAGGPGTQDAHCDFSKTALTGRKRGTGNATVPYPWCMDIPLNQSGLNLNIWHSFSPDKDCAPENYNIEVFIPPGWCILWRGDLVHAGGCPAIQGGDIGLRIHWYIPAKTDDIGGISGNDGRVDRGGYRK